ncbi:diacylglycerol kinase [Blastopirellula marina]|nr:diacylglycerol kinase [Blastopirellula marina]
MKNEMTPQGWVRKFQLAFSGLFWAIRTEGSFSVHLPAAALAISGAVLLSFDPGRWAVLVGMIGMVLTAELLNTALETLAQAVDEDHNHHIKRALDTASAAVLTISMTAVVVGGFLFWHPFWTWWARTMTS